MMDYGNRTRNAHVLFWTPVGWVVVGISENKCIHVGESPDKCIAALDGDSLFVVTLCWLSFEVRSSLGSRS